MEASAGPVHAVDDVTGLPSTAYGRVMSSQANYFRVRLHGTPEGAGEVPDVRPLALNDLWPQAVPPSGQGASSVLVLFRTPIVIAIEHTIYMVTLTSAWHTASHTLDDDGQRARRSSCYARRAH